MNIRIPVAALAATAALTAGCATSGTTPATARPTYNDCIFARTLSDWRPLDDQNLILFGNGRRPYLVELVRPIPGLDFNFMIGVYDRDGQICPFGGDAIIVRGVMPETVSIRSMRRLTDEQLDDIYVQFGVRPPEVVDVDPADPNGGGEPQN
jgi:hypothetical protein